MRSTSVPRWRSDYSAVDQLSSGALVTCYALLVDSSVDEPSQSELCSRVAPVTTRMWLLDDPDIPGVLDELLSAARIGWRFVVAGTEQTVTRVRARLISAGAIPAEIATVVTDRGDTCEPRIRDVYCAHCHTTTQRAPVEIGGQTSCTGCSAELTVYYHFSRRHSAYLGYRADAEELP